MVPKEIYYNSKSVARGFDRGFWRVEGSTYEGIFFMWAWMHQGDDLESTYDASDAHLIKYPRKFDFSPPNFFSKLV